MKEYNTLLEQGTDIEFVGRNSTIVWACSTSLFPFQARDFCTLVHVRKLDNNTYIVLNKAIDHPKAPITKKYTRGSIIIGANIIRTIPGEPEKCYVIMITQVDPGGFLPPMIVNQLCTFGPILIMRGIEESAHR